MDAEDIKPGDLILVRGSGWISHAIEDVEKSLYSHIAGYVGEGEIIEAEGFSETGYALMSKYKGCADVFRCDSLTGEQRKQILHLAAFRVGGRYDYVLLFVELIRYWLGVLVPYREPPNTRVCSTLWATGIYKDAGIDLCPSVKFPSPADVAESKLLRKIGSI